MAGAGAPAHAAELGWPILADPRSGLRGTATAVAAFDGILRCDGVPQPDVVLRVGEPPASKVLSQWLASLPDEVVQVIVDPTGGWPDPERRANLRVPALPTSGLPVADDAWTQWWRDAEAAAQTAIDEALAADAIGVTEPGIIRALTRDLPQDATIFVSSSMPIRDIEWFGDPASTHRVLSNRGANGIDGVVSTALGVAAADPSTPVVAVVGDLAFLYDTGALLWAARRDVDLTIVVIDNDGGGIFSFLPQRDHVDASRFETYFGTPHGVDIRALAALHQIPVVDHVGEGSGVRLLVVRSERDRNVDVHRRLNDAIAAAVGTFR